MISTADRRQWGFQPPTELPAIDITYRVLEDHLVPILMITERSGNTFILRLSVACPLQQVST
jgi:hypothetical protein